MGLEIERLGHAQHLSVKVFVHGLLFNPVATPDLRLCKIFKKLFFQKMQVIQHAIYSKQEEGS